MYIFVIKIFLTKVKKITEAHFFPLSKIITCTSDVMFLSTSVYSLSSYVQAPINQAAFPHGPTAIANEAILSRDNLFPSPLLYKSARAKALTDLVCDD